MLANKTYNNTNNYKKSNVDIDTDIYIEILNYQSDDITNIINKLNNKIKLDDNRTGTFIPKYLNQENFIIVSKKKYSNDIMSLIWYGFYNNEKFGRILHVNFSYTFNEFRSKGLNKLLRFELEKICIQNNVQFITSTPFENSPSKKILINLGYVSELNFFYKKIF
jgi:hypothetical protein